MDIWEKNRNKYRQMNWYKKAQIQETLPYFLEFKEYGDYVPNEKMINEKLSKMGLSIIGTIGSGDSGVAYSLSNGDILKITTNDQEGKVAQYILNNPCKYIISYKDVWKMGDLYYIIMEKLDNLVINNNALNTIFSNLVKILNEQKCYDINCSLRVLPQDKYFRSLENGLKSKIINYLLYIKNIDINIFDFLNPNNIGIKDGDIKFFDIT